MLSQSHNLLNLFLAIVFSICAHTFTSNCQLPFLNQRNGGEYCKCPKNSNTKVSDKMTYANSADPDQTAPEGAVWSGSVCHSTKYFKKQVHKKHNLGQSSRE